MVHYPSFKQMHESMLEKMHFEQLWTDRQMAEQTDRQTDRQIDRKIDTELLQWLIPAWWIELKEMEYKQEFATYVSNLQSNKRMY